MIRGFATGLVWGGVAAGLGLAVISQVAPRPGLPPVVVAAGNVPAPDTVDTTAPAGTGTAPANETGLPAEPLPVPIPSVPVTPPLPVPVPAPEQVAAAQTPSQSAPTAPAAAPVAPPQVGSAVQAPSAPPDVDSATRPEVPALTGTGTGALDPMANAAPKALAVPDTAAADAPTVETDLPPPELQDSLLLPAPTPQPGIAPARVGIEQTPVSDAAPLPRAAMPAPDAAPELPVARPLPVPVPDAQADAAPADPQTPAIEVPAPVLQPVRPIIAEAAPRTLAPDPGLPGTDGVRIGQLPKIGGDAGRALAPAAQGGSDDGPPLQRFARPFENPDAKPLFSILLRDTGEADLDRAALAQISFPVSFVIDPLMPGATAAAEIYRAAGQEVLMLASGIPQGATPADLEQSFQSLGGMLPEAVGVMDQPTGGFQGDRPLATQVVPILAAQGRGLVTFDGGLNAADQEARRADLPSAMIFRRLDAEAESTVTIRRYLDRAAFKAAQEGRVVVLGDTRPETVAAVLEWAVEGRAAAVALAPITAAMANP